MKDRTMPNEIQMTDRDYLGQWGQIWSWGIDVHVCGIGDETYLPGISDEWLDWCKRNDIRIDYVFNSDGSIDPIRSTLHKTWSDCGYGGQISLSMLEDDIEIENMMICRLSDCGSSFRWVDSENSVVEIIDGDEWVLVGGELSSGDRDGQIIRCYGTGELLQRSNASRWNDYWYSDEWLNENTFHCDYCGERYDNDDYGSDSICTHCESNREDESSEYSADDVWQIIERKVNSDTHPYKSPVKENLRQWFGGRAFGVELELYRKHSGESAVTGSTVWQSHYDGSLCESPDSYTGSEYVSMPLFARELFREVRTFSKWAKRNDCRVNRTCGFHLHIDCTGATIDKLMRVYRAFYMLQNMVFAALPKSRNGNDYCQHVKLPSTYTNANSLINQIYWHDEDSIDCNGFDPHEKYGDSRYVALNGKPLVKYGTLEIRCHSGTIDDRKILAWCSLWGCVFQFCLDTDAPLPQSITSWDDVARGFNVPQQVVDFYKQRTAKFSQ